MQLRSYYVSDSRTIFSPDNQEFLICDVSLEQERIVFSFLLIEDKKPKSRSSTAASWLLVPLCPRPSFLPLCLTAIRTAHPSAILHPPILSARSTLSLSLSFSQNLPGSRSTPPTLPCLYCFLPPPRIVILYDREKETTLSLLWCFRNSTSSLFHDAHMRESWII